MSDNKPSERQLKFLKAIEKLNLEFPVAEISRKTGYKEGTISPYLKPEGKASSKFILKIAEVFGFDASPILKATSVPTDLEAPDNEAQGINDSPVIYRKNEARLRGDHSSEQFYMNSAGKVFTQIGEDSYIIHTPLVQKKARAGFLMGWGDETYINQLPTHPIVVDKPYKGYYVSFDVVGDSMDDGTKQAISEGDIVTGRRIDRSLWTSQLHFTTYPDYVIHTRDGLLVKRIIAHNVKEGYITIHSLNPDKETYPDQDISLEDVAELFNIIKVTSDRKAR